MFNKKFGFSLILSIVLLSTSVTVFASDRESIKGEKDSIIQELQQDKNIKVDDLDENNIIITSPENIDENYDKKETLRKLEESMLSIDRINQELQENNENSIQERSVLEHRYQLEDHNERSYKDGYCRAKLRSTVVVDFGRTDISGHAYGIWDGMNPREADSMSFRNTIICTGVGLSADGGSSGWNISGGLSEKTYEKDLTCRKGHLLMHDFTGVTLGGNTLSVREISSCDFKFGSVTYTVEATDKTSV